MIQRKAIRILRAGISTAMRSIVVVVLFIDGFIFTDEKLTEWFSLVNLMKKQWRLAEQHKGYRWMKREKIELDAFRKGKKQRDIFGEREREREKTSAFLFLAFCVFSSLFFFLHQLSLWCFEAMIKRHGTSSILSRTEFHLSFMLNNLQRSNEFKASLIVLLDHATNHWMIDNLYYLQSK